MDKNILNHANRLAEVLGGVVGSPATNGGYNYVPVKSGKANLAIVCGNGTVGFRLESARREATPVPAGYVKASREDEEVACKQAFPRNPKEGLWAYDWYVAAAATTAQKEETVQVSLTVDQLRMLRKLLGGI